jgi:exodeoxyribonuclease VII small subunit
MTTTPAATTFEALLVQLQETVTRLESDELTLEEAISAYEQSVEIAHQCTRMLDEAELRITTIDAQSRTLREESAVYNIGSTRAASLLLGDDEDDDDLADLLDDE